MISQVESGLSQTEYDSLLAATHAPNFSVIAHRWNLDFSDWATGAQSNVGDDWDAINNDTYIYRVYGRGVTANFQRITLADGTLYNTQILSLGGIAPNTRYRLALGTTAGTLYCYANANGGLYRSTSTDYGANWSVWSNLISDSAVTRQSADQFVFGTATASTTDPYEFSDYSAPRAFDNNRESFWKTVSGTLTGWLKYQLPAAVALTKYTITAFGPGAGAPRTWTFEGSNNDSSWTTLDTQTNVADWASDGEAKSFTFANTTAYLYYRLNVTVTRAGANALRIGELAGYYTESIAQYDDIAVPQYDRIIYTHYDETKNLYRLGKASYAGTWQNDFSDIWLTYRPRSIEAVTVDDPDDPLSAHPYYDVIVLNTERPGPLKIVSEDNEPIRYYANSEGLLAYRIRCNTLIPSNGYIWSETFEIDKLDEANAGNYRQYARLSVINGSIYLTSHSSDGISDYANVGTRIYSTKLGRYWSLGNLLPVESTVGLYAIKLLQVGDYVYAVERSNIDRSLCTLQFGYSPASQQLDLTPYVLEYQTDQSSIFSANITLANDTGLFTNHSWFNKQNVIALVHRTGYFVDGEFLDYQVGITEVDAFETPHSLPEQIVRLVSRDHLAWMSDKFASENAKYWNSLRAAADNYLDKTGTNYGGLSHTSIQSGQWETVDSTLVCKSTDPNASPSGDGIVFATDPSEVQNGMVQVGFKLQDSAFTRAGVIFRAIDRWNYWQVLYRPDVDQITLERHWGEDGNPDSSETTVSGNPGWTNVDTTWHYIRVVFYYGTISVYYSDDSQSWTHNFDYQIDASERYYGSPYLKKADNLVIEKGYIGLQAQTMPTTETVFQEFRAFEFGSLHTVEHAFKAYAALAGIHDTQFDTLTYSTDVGTGWNKSVTDFAWEEIPGLPGFSLYDTDDWDVAITNTGMTGHNLVVETSVIFSGGVKFGIVMRALDDGTYYIAGRDENGYPVIVYYNGITYTTVYTGAFTYEETPLHATVSFQEVNTGSDTDTFWHIISMWWNDKLVAVYIDNYGTSPISGTINWGLATGSSTIALFYSPRLPELNVVSDWTTLDPAEKPMSALSRAIEGLNLRFFIRFDGTLYAWKPKAVTEKFDYSNQDLMADYNDLFDQRKLRTAIRVVGGYAEATYHDLDLIRQYEYRFEEVNNPFIITHNESYREAQLVIKRMLEQATQTQFTYPHTPFLEPEDRVNTPDGDRLITSIAVQYAGPLHNQQLSLRGYPYGEP